MPYVLHFFLFIYIFKLRGTIRSLINVTSRLFIYEGQCSSNIPYCSSNYNLFCRHWRAAAAAAAAAVAETFDDSKHFHINKTNFGSIVRQQIAFMFFGNILY